MRAKHPSDMLRIWVGQKPFDSLGLWTRVDPVDQFHFVVDSSSIQRDLHYLIRNAGRLGLIHSRGHTTRDGYDGNDGWKAGTPAASAASIHG
jgi:hypothetical protein